MKLAAEKLISVSSARDGLNIRKLYKTKRRLFHVDGDHPLFLYTFSLTHSLLLRSCVCKCAIAQFGQLVEV